MEDDLDRIAAGEADRVDWLNGFYFGSDDAPRACARSSTTSATSTPARSTRCSIAPDITLRIGKYGPYLETVDPDAAPDATPRRVNLPADLAPDELTEAKARELIEAPVQSDRVLGVNPENGKQVVVKDGRFGPYVTELEPEPEARPRHPSTRRPARSSRRRSRSGARRRPPRSKPRTASLFKSMQIEEIDLDTALKLLDLPARRRASTPSPARRSPRRTAATAPTSRRAPTPARCRARTRSSRSTCRVRSSSSRSRSTAPDVRRARSRSSTTTR